MTEQTITHDIGQTIQALRQLGVGPTWCWAHPEGIERAYEAGWIVGPMVLIESRFGDTPSTYTSEYTKDFDPALMGSWYERRVYSEENVGWDGGNAR